MTTGRGAAALGPRQPPAAERAHAISNCVDLVGATSGVHDVATGLGETDGDALADAASCARRHPNTFQEDHD